MLDLKPLIDKMNLDLLDQVYFNDAFIQRIQFYREERRVVLELNLKQNLTFDLYQKFVHELERVLGIKASLLLNVEDNDLTQKDLQRYVNHCIEEHDWSLLQVNRLYTFEQGVLYFMIESDVIHSLWSVNCLICPVH